MMDDLYRHYLIAHGTGLAVDIAGEHMYTCPSRTDPDQLYFIHYDGTGLPLCKCKAGMAGKHCWHRAAVIAYVHSGIQAGWEHRRLYETRSFWLRIRQGKTTPRRHPKIRRAMNEINERHPVTIREAVCTRCGLVEASDLCPSCKAALDKIWPGCPEFARELEQTDQDERWRLKLGMGE